MNPYDRQQLEQHREHLADNIKRQTAFIEWLRSQHDKDDTATLTRAEATLIMFSQELTDFNLKNPIN